MKYNSSDFMNTLVELNPQQPEFHQAVNEFVEEVVPFINANEKYQKYSLLERLTEPDRALSFRVTWLDDNANVQVNKGYRVQFSNAIGPYKGGLRFHPTVNLSILKFLGFEQVFKNSLTTLPMGGGKGGSDFDPKGKSDSEVMRFCQAFMTELRNVIGPDMDVPAGDIGVGGREIGYLYGQYKKLTRQHQGILTGKGMSFGGSLIRPEATGYGSVYFANEALKKAGLLIEDKSCIISGSGNVAHYCAEKLLDLGAKILTMSDSGGFVYNPDGIDREQLDYIMDLKNNRRGRIHEFAEHYGLKYYPNEKPWSINADLAFPCATQNELNLEDAKNLVKNNVMLVAEGANMPTEREAIDYFKRNNVIFSPGKASNAGGVATSGLEMTQNSMRISWSRQEVDDKLLTIMKNIHEKCVEYGGKNNGVVDYVKGANIAGFVKVADAMIAQGVI